MGHKIHPRTIELLILIERNPHQFGWQLRHRIDRNAFSRTNQGYSPKVGFSGVIMTQ
jgi:hypothetical protein